MNKACKILGKIVLIVISIVVLLFLALLIYLKMLFPAVPTYDEIYELYLERNEAIMEVFSYSLEMESMVIWLNYKYDKKFTVNDFSKLPVTKINDLSENLNRALMELDSENCGVITKDNLHIKLQFWSTLDDGCGLVYFFTDKIELVNNRSYILEPLDNTGWYYYRESINDKF